ncbi:basic helix-loop-helix (bHLH) DNA-binding superfamily protein [Quillaja saponaria]|uniref:Basic helix-loop-helix (BHLH) DNA-binding superfamily protein n=1 Tax=Quillaja saponaria TaxID=32244 RepID=A0AAD7PU42_QUISA|nr:basic helix-loop-helix (bHLH) DNA-binding superfamily protein [Quillaja saponaria]
MDNVYRELDEFKTELEKLKLEHRIKTELSESLKKAHSEQLLRFQEAKQKLEKQSEELNFKSEEITKERKLSNDLKSKENKKLALALDETTARNKELEWNVCASNHEIGGLRKLLLIAENKCSDAEVRAQEAKEQCRRDDILMNLEEENRDVLDKLKWKSEQFKHLEEAHKKLQGQFQLNKEEWEREKLALLEEISSLQTSMDSQTRILEGLQSRLEMCNQALAHEESKRKFLEVEVSEFKSRFEAVFSQCQEEKSKIHDLTYKRDEEIAKLRNSMGEKEILAREMELRIVHLEQENQELGESLKELREAQIHNDGASSMLSKLRNKLRGLEKVHKKCSSNPKTKESEWSVQLKNMEGDISSYKSKLKLKENKIQELQMDIENCNSTIEILHEEVSMVLLIFKLEFSEAYFKILSAEAEREAHIKEKNFICAEQSQVKDSSQKPFDLMQHNNELTFLKKVESLEHREHQVLMMEEQLRIHKKLLEESTEGHLKEQLLLKESSIRGEKRDAYEALEKIKIELAEKDHELHRLEKELQSWKSTTESLKTSSEDNEKTCKQIKTSLIACVENERTLKHEKESLLCIVKDQERKNEDLKQQILLLEASNAEKMKEMESFKEEKQNLLVIAEEKDSCIKILLEDIAYVKQESMRRESEAVLIAQLTVDMALEQEKERLLEIINEKEQSVKYFQALALSLEKESTSALISSFSEQVEKEVVASMLTEALKNAGYVSKLEIEERNMIIGKLEIEHSHHNHLLQKVAYQEKTFSHLKQAEPLQVLLEAKNLETAKLMEELRNMESLVEKLEIGEFSVEDAQLMKTLGSILHVAAEVNEMEDPVVPDKLHYSTSGNANASICAATKKLEVNVDERLPLKEVNSWQM